MTIKNMLVAYNGTKSADAALRYAASLANHHQAHVTALLAHGASDSYAAGSRWIPRETRQIIDRAHNDALKTIESRFQTLETELGLGDRLHWVEKTGRTDRIVADFARYHDIAIIGRVGPGVEDAHVFLSPDKVALQSGRPVLIIPETTRGKAQIDHAVLAWDGRRAAARALSDSMRILKTTALVSILTVGDEGLQHPVSDLVTHLERHGVRSTHVHVAQSGPIAQPILDFCAENNPGILVMGAYEHSKFREDLLGGVTATVLRECPLPVLMSH